MRFGYTCLAVIFQSFRFIISHLMEQVYALDLASSSKTNGLRSSSSHRCKSYAQNMVGLINRLILRDKNVVKHVMDLWHVECTYVFVSFSSAPRLKVAENCLSDPVFRVRRTLRATFGSILSQFSTHPLSLGISNIQIGFGTTDPVAGSHSAKSRWQDLKPPT